VFSNAFTGEFIQLHEWTVRLAPRLVSYFMVGGQNFISASEYVSADARTARALLRYASISMTLMAALKCPQLQFDQLCRRLWRGKFRNPPNAVFVLLDERCWGIVADGCV